MKVSHDKRRGFLEVRVALAVMAASLTACGPALPGPDLDSAAMDTQPQIETDAALGEDERGHDEDGDGDEEQGDEGELPAPCSDNDACSGGMCVPHIMFKTGACEPGQWCCAPACVDELDCGSSEICQEAGEIDFCREG